MNEKKQIYVKDQQLITQKLTLQYSIWLNKIMKKMIIKQF